MAKTVDVIELTTLLEIDEGPTTVTFAADTLVEITFPDDDEITINKVANINAITIDKTVLIVQHRIILTSKPRRPPVPIVLGFPMGILFNRN